MAFLMYSTACMAIAADTDKNSSHAIQRNVMTALKDTAMFFKRKAICWIINYCILAKKSDCSPWLKIYFMAS